MSPNAAIKRVCALAAALEDRRMPALEQLDQLQEVVQAAELAQRLLVDSMRTREGASWSKIGAALGVSKQAAHQRFGEKVIPDEMSAGGVPLFD